MMEVREQVLRGLTQIDRDLEQARRDLERAKKLDDMVAEMREQHKLRREASEQAWRCWPGGGAGIGRRERPFDRPLGWNAGGPGETGGEPGTYGAQARYEAALWDLSDLEDRLWTAKEERAGLEGVEERYQALLGEKERFLCCTGSTQVQRLVQIAKELGSVRSGLQDLKDAVQAGEAAQVQLRAMTGTLESAREWESWGAGRPSVCGGPDGGDWRRSRPRVERSARLSAACGPSWPGCPRRRCPGPTWKDFWPLRTTFLRGCFPTSFPTPAWSGPRGRWKTSCVR